MNNFEKIMEITRPWREPEPLWEPCPFELAESRLKILNRKILFVSSPNDIKNTSSSTEIRKDLHCGTFIEAAGRKMIYDALQKIIKEKENEKQIKSVEY